MKLKKISFFILLLSIFGTGSMATPIITADTVCAGSVTHFSLSNSAGITSVHWDFGDFFNGDSSTLFNPVYLFSGAGTFTVKLIYQFGASVDSVFQDIIVLGIPTPELPSDYTLCPGTYGLNANYPFGDNYLWSTGATTQSIQFNISGVYWIRVENNCGIGSDTINATIIYPPIAQLPTELYLCPDTDNDTLIAGPNNMLFNYQWSGGETTNHILVSEPGSYFVHVQNQCGSIDEYCNVDYLQPPTVQLGTNDTILCGNTQQLSFNTFIPTCPTCSYNWSDGTIVPFNVISTEGKSWVTISNECGIASDTVSINLLPYPDMIFENDTTICNDEKLTFQLSFEGGDFLWQDGSTDSIYTIDTSGKYYVTQHNFCASLTDTIVVKKLTLSVNIGITDTLLCRGEKLLIDVTQPEGIYNWNTGSTDSTLEISNEGIYKVSVSNYCGMVDDEVQVYYQNCDACLHIPTAFSPNQDGHNDRFRILHDCLLTNFELHIYNRWGQEVYSSTNPDLSWDGKFISVDQPVGVYVYQLNYSKTDLVNTTSEYLTGNISLIR